MSRRSRARDLARRVLDRPRLGPMVAGAIGRTGEAATTAGPRLESLYRRLPSSSGLPYGTSRTQQHRALLTYYATLRERMKGAGVAPTFSVVVPVYRPDHGYFREMLASVALQTYPHWQLCAVDDASGDPVIAQILAEFADTHPGKVSWRVREENGHIVAASNDALALATGDYVALVDHDDRLYPHALAEVALAIDDRVADGAEPPLVLYTDERMIDEAGAPIGEAWLKPDWMPLLHLTSNYTNHLTVYDADLLRELGGFRHGFEGSQDHDLMLRATEVCAERDRPVVHVPSIAYQWRSHPGSVARDPGVKSYSVEPAMRAVAQACARRGIPARVWREPGIVANRVDFEVSEPPPEVEVLRVADAAVTVGSALEETAADYLVVLDPELSELRPDWQTAMLCLAQLPGVGAVGGLILDHEGRVSEAGLIGVGSGGVVPAMRGMAPTEDVYLAWPASIHEVLAVSGRAVMIDVAAARAAGGVDRDSGGFWAADLCLRLRARGGTTVFTPYAEFAEPPDARAREPRVDLDERRRLLRRWALELSDDPYLNPGLARDPHFRVDPTLTLPEIPRELFAGWLRAGCLD